MFFHQLSLTVAYLQFHGCEMQLALQVKHPVNLQSNIYNNIPKLYMHEGMIQRWETFVE